MSEAGRLSVRFIVKAGCCLVAAIGTLNARASGCRTNAPVNVFNLDATHYTYEYGDDKMNAEGLREYVHRVLGKGAFTHFFICPGMQTTLCDTKTM